MMTLIINYKINGFIDASTSDDNKGPDSLIPSNFSPESVSESDQFRHSHVMVTIRKTK